MHVIRYLFIYLDIGIDRTELILMLFLYTDCYSYSRPLGGLPTEKRIFCGRQQRGVCTGDRRRLLPEHPGHTLQPAHLQVVDVVYSVFIVLYTYCVYYIHTVYTSVHHLHYSTNNSSYLLFFLP